MIIEFTSTTNVQFKGLANVNHQVGDTLLLPVLGTDERAFLVVSNRHWDYSGEQTKLNIELSFKLTAGSEEEILQYIESNMTPSECLKAFATQKDLLISRIKSRQSLDQKGIKYTIIGGDDGTLTSLLTKIDAIAKSTGKLDLKLTKEYFNTIGYLDSIQMNYRA